MIKNYNEIFKKILEKNDFEVEKSSSLLSISTHTSGGIEQNIEIEEGEDFLEKFKNIVENYDVENEVERHRKAFKSYRECTGLRASLCEFERYLEKLEKTWKEIKKENSKSN